MSVDKCEGLSSDSFNFNGFNYASLVRIFGSKMKADEILLMLNDKKKVVRQGFYDYELEGVLDFCRREKLFFRKSKFKVRLKDVNGLEEDFSNKGEKIFLKDNKDGMYFCYISKSEKEVCLAEFYELKNDHFNLGLILGYPKCCIEYFCKEFNSGQTNPVHKINLDKKFEKLIRLDLRGNDLVLISHFPCSNECVLSLKIAKSNLEFFKEINEKRANELVDKLVNR